MKLIELTEQAIAKFTAHSQNTHAVYLDATILNVLLMLNKRYIPETDAVIRQEKISQLIQRLFKDYSDLYQKEGELVNAFLEKKFSKALIEYDTLSRYEQGEANKYRNDFKEYLSSLKENIINAVDFADDEQQKINNQVYEVFTALYDSLYDPEKMNPETYLTPLNELLVNGLDRKNTVVIYNIIDDLYKQLCLHDNDDPDGNLIPIKMTLNTIKIKEKNKKQIFTLFKTVYNTLNTLINGGIKGYQIPLKEALALVYAALTDTAAYPPENQHETNLRIHSLFTTHNELRTGKYKSGTCNPGIRNDSVKTLSGVYPGVLIIEEIKVYFYAVFAKVLGEKIKLLPEEQQIKYFCAAHCLYSTWADEYALFLRQEIQAEFISDLFDSEIEKHHLPIIGEALNSLKKEYIQTVELDPLSLPSPTEVFEDEIVVKALFEKINKPNQSDEIKAIQTKAENCQSISELKTVIRRFNETMALREKVKSFYQHHYFFIQDSDKGAIIRDLSDAIKSYFEKFEEIHFEKIIELTPQFYNILNESGNIKPDFIENFFIHWNKDKEPHHIRTMLEQYIHNRKASLILNDQQINRLIEDIREENYINLTPFIINRVLLQGMLTSPAHWTLLFRDIFERIVHFLEQDLSVQVLSQAYLDLRKNSYTSSLLTHLKFILFFTGSGHINRDQCCEKFPIHNRDNYPFETYYPISLEDVICDGLSSFIYLVKKFQNNKSLSHLEKSRHLINIREKISILLNAEPEDFFKRFSPELIHSIYKLLAEENDAEIKRDFLEKLINDIGINVMMTKINACNISQICGDPHGFNLFLNGFNLALGFIPDKSINFDDNAFQNIIKKQFSQAVKIRNDLFCKIANLPVLINHYLSVAIVPSHPFNGKFSIQEKYKLYSQLENIDYFLCQLPLDDLTSIILNVLDYNFTNLLLFPKAFNKFISQINQNAEIFHKIFAYQSSKLYFTDFLTSTEESQESQTSVFKKLIAKFKENPSTAFPLNFTTQILQAQLKRLPLPAEEDEDLKLLNEIISIYDKLTIFYSRYSITIEDSDKRLVITALKHDIELYLTTWDDALPQRINELKERFLEIVVEYDIPNAHLVNQYFQIWDSETRVFEFRSQFEASFQSNRKSMLLNEQQLQCLFNEIQAHKFKNITPFMINRVLLQGMLTSPAEWTPLFKETFLLIVELLETRLSPHEMSAEYQEVNVTYSGCILKHLDFIVFFANTGNINRVRFFEQFPSYKMEYLFQSYFPFTLDNVICPGFSSFIYLANLTQNNKALSFYQRQHVLKNLIGEINNVLKLEGPAFLAKFNPNGSLHYPYRSNQSIEISAEQHAIYLQNLVSDIPIEILTTKMNAPLPQTHEYNFILGCLNDKSLILNYDAFLEIIRYKSFQYDIRRDAFSKIANLPQLIKTYLSNDVEMKHVMAIYGKKVFTYLPTRMEYPYYRIDDYLSPMPVNALMDILYQVYQQGAYEYTFFPIAFDKVFSEADLNSELFIRLISLKSTTPYLSHFLSSKDIPEEKQIAVFKKLLMLNQTGNDLRFQISKTLFCKETLLETCLDYFSISELILLHLDNRHPDNFLHDLISYFDESNQLNRLAEFFVMPNFNDIVTVLILLNYGRPTLPTLTLNKLLSPEIIALALVKNIQDFSPYSRDCLFAAIDINNLHRMLPWDQFIDFIRKLTEETFHYFLDFSLTTIPESLHQLQFLKSFPFAASYIKRNLFLIAENFDLVTLLEHDICSTDRILFSPATNTYRHFNKLIEVIGISGLSLFLHDKSTFKSFYQYIKSNNIPLTDESLKLLTLYEKHKKLADNLFLVLQNKDLLPEDKCRTLLEAYLPSKTSTKFFERALNRHYAEEIKILLEDKDLNAHEITQKVLEIQPDNASGHLALIQEFFKAFSFKAEDNKPIDIIMMIKSHQHALT